MHSVSIFFAMKKDLSEFHITYYYVVVGVNLFAGYHVYL